MGNKKRSVKTGEGYRSGVGGLLGVGFDLATKTAHGPRGSLQQLEGSLGPTGVVGYWVGGMGEGAALGEGLGNNNRDTAEQGALAKVCHINETDKVNGWKRPCQKPRDYGRWGRCSLTSPQHNLWWGGSTAGRHD